MKASEKSELQSMLERLSRLERQNRRLKSCGFVFLWGFLVFLLWAKRAAEIPEVLEAQKFALRDSQGHGRAALASRRTTHRYSSLTKQTEPLVQRSLLDLKEGQRYHSTTALVSRVPYYHWTPMAPRDSP